MLSEEKPKVYCSECEFCTDKPYRAPGTAYSPYVPGCINRRNITLRQAPLAVMYTAIKEPKEINKDNDCSWYLKKRGFIARLLKGRHRDRMGSGKKVYLPEWPGPPPRKP